jgi:hypothetical protein
MNTENNHAFVSYGLYSGSLSYNDSYHDLTHPLPFSTQDHLHDWLTNDNFVPKMSLIHLIGGPTECQLSHHLRRNG